MPKTGCFTPSRFADAMTNGRGKDTIGQTAMGLVYQIAMERIGVFKDDITAPALEWGKEWESVAIQNYQKETFINVEQFLAPITHPKYSFIAGTPDGMANDGGKLIEVKCPYNPQNHLHNLIDGAQIKIYQYQIQGYMWITGAKNCDFVSYDPRYPDHLKISIHTIQRDDALITSIEDRILLLEEMVVNLLNTIEMPESISCTLK